MRLTDVKVELSESPFTFDVWRCPKCGYVVTDEQYMQSAFNYACVGCQRTTLSEYNLWPGKRENETEH